MLGLQTVSWHAMENRIEVRALIVSDWFTNRIGPTVGFEYHFYHVDTSDSWTLLKAGVDYSNTLAIKPGANIMGKHYYAHTTIFLSRLSRIFDF